MIIIERFKNTDADNVSKIIIDDLEIHNTVDYPPDVIRILAASYSPADLVLYAKSDEIFIARESTDSEVVGTVSLSGHQVRNLFIKDGHHHRGIGRTLMAHIEDIARQRALKTLFLQANPTAVGYYLKLNYQVVEDKNISINDHPVRMVKMEKTV